MRIILLSGGSGKRLWPLSNDTRSKQFLKLMDDGYGNYESMVQRLYRQIQEARIDAEIVVATSINQKDSIRNHLGDSVDIVLEPERRNTFPAIALSSAYLEYEKRCNPEEVVIVLPVDSYVDSTYFETLKLIEEAVKDNEANLILMGIKPTYPSEKYGYMIPEFITENDPIKIKEFKEKPSLKKATELISKGAMWNGGVFAYKLRYLSDIIKEHIDAQNYQDIYSRYNELEKTSFDYEVVEKEKSVAMISYNGKWKDLGTWNTLTEEMSKTCFGNVVEDNDTNNTHVINELEIPVLVMGVNNSVVVASPDGILVSDKQKSSYMKEYVEKFTQRPMFEERRWGEYKVLDYCKYNDVHTLTKHMFIKAGKCISYQTHKQRDEIWTFVDGTGDLVIDGHVRNVRRGDVAYITKGQKHSLKATTNLHFIEVQIGDELTEADIQRYEWEW